LEKGKPFVEVLASAIHEDYRFPILEIFTFLYTLGTFVFANFGSIIATQSLTNESIAYTLTSSLLGLPLFIFIILIFKNIAYGFGSDLEKGIIQSYLSYPLKRWRILTAKLLSAIGIPLILFLTIQISALYILAPDVISPYLSTVILTYVATLAPSLFVAGIMLLVTLFLMRGGLTLVIGIVLYFALSIISSLAIVIAFASNSSLPLQIMSVIAPNVALAEYYSVDIPLGNILWSPAFSDVLLFLGTSYVIIAFLFILGYYYFSRRLGL
jgi:ABC-type transport system involved in multi-copper enzyme maturation permease subunit